MTRPDTDGLARTVLTFVLAGLIAVFVGFAIDTVYPAPKDPSQPDLSAAQLHEFADRRNEISKKQESGAITQEQADALFEEIDNEESGASIVVSDRAFAEFESAMWRRNLTVTLATLASACALAAVGAVLFRRGVPMGSAPLLSSGVLMILAVVLSLTAWLTPVQPSSQGPPVWLRLLVGVISAAVSIGAGSWAFRETAGDVGDAAPADAA